MIASSPQDRQLYNARLKMERDAAAKLQFAKEEGLDEGLAKGECIGQIRLLQRLLGQPELPTSELATLTLDQLSKQATQLQAQLAAR
ncbi:MAG: hypothetical protein ACKV0T_19045 [Planctomycetales bacterium]